MSQFHNRILSYGTKPAEQFTANPRNPRVHPQFQREVMRAALETLGWLAPVIENARTGYLIDGHERVMQALQNNEEVPYVTVDLDETEEATALATFDPIGALATYDAAVLDDLLREVATDNPALDKMLSELATGFHEATDSEWESALGDLATGDRAPFQQMTFTLHDDQAAIVKDAISLANRLDFDQDTPNENSNGNALSFICSQFMVQHG